jgi:hypothetical protein
MTTERNYETREFPPLTELERNFMSEHCVCVGNFTPEMAKCNVHSVRWLLRMRDMLASKCMCMKPGCGTCSRRDCKARYMGHYRVIAKHGHCRACLSKEKPPRDSKQKKK